LDGLRAVAVLCVIAYHLNVPWAKGGLLGVGVFFTLSGYLITDLLLSSWNRYGDLRLGRFWWHRARRLLPALLVMLVVVSILVALFDASQLSEVRRQVVSAALYFANWSTIAVHGSYFSRFAAPLPLDHLWSLSIEEQFYLVWPWLLLLLVFIVPSRRLMAGLTLLGAAASVLAMAELYRRGYDPTRVYEGTDTRAFGLLIGAALAMVRPMGGTRENLGTLSRRTRLQSVTRSPVRMDLAGTVGLIVILALVWRTTSLSAFLYPWGLILLSAATVLVLAAVVNPSSQLGDVLGCPPLRWVGVRSYGIYLWHWPIIVLWGASQSTGVNWPRSLLQVAVTMIVAGLSWQYVEEPIRHGALGRLRRRSQTRAAVIRARRRALAILTSTFGVVSIVVASLAGVLPVASAGDTTPPKINHLPPRLASAAAARAGTSANSSTTTRAGRTGASSGSGNFRFLESKLPPATRTSCRSAVYIGDSTSEGEISTDYIPDASQRLGPQLARVGVKTLYPEISGARSIVEVYHGHPNAATVATEHIESGFRGCWILALGTNDVANSATANIGMQQRIDRMMSVIGRQPVMWVSAITLLSAGPYAESGMERWDHLLLDACRRYPNMRVYDWADQARRKWFIPDGIHYYSPGYVARTHDIAEGLVHAFPDFRQPSPTCLVQ
jgi:peptidoglycan/LPS O-acetylase OafA/YrhL